MDISEATELIRIDKITGTNAQTWCDFGCGTGTFTLALATLLPSGSVIYAVDKDEKLLKQIPDRYKEVTIHKQIVDLEVNDLPLPALNGVLMANFLHFVKLQGAFVEKLRTLSERLLIVEYEDRAPSRWVPYPLGFSALQNLLRGRGFTEIVKGGTRPSRFGGEMYSALAELDSSQS
ncbi:class I SAM-dependent methyltransferase [Granulicella sp. dw_53]|uniref:class I SAM-dependent methyltransferase n=1 Tax=Granulicella sp. dw_53 TaxID=2719792 RepID=UPI001BD67D73|nr:class I SAM-dependent methyltransferase [Granulicella sp. dw_53]